LHVGELYFDTLIYVILFYILAKRCMMSMVHNKYWTMIRCTFF